MGNIEHWAWQMEVCTRSGQLPWECGLAACDNGCETRTVEVVSLDQLKGAVEERDEALRLLGGSVPSARQDRQRWLAEYRALRARVGGR